MTNSRNDGNGPAPTEQDEIFDKVVFSGYKPKIEAIDAYATMQYVAMLHKKTVAEMAKLLGHSSPYQWMKAIQEAEAKALAEIEKEAAKK